jgi:hypothetical protein
MYLYRFVMMGAVLLAAVGCGAGEPMETGESEAPVGVSSQLEAAATGGDAALVPASCGTCYTTYKTCLLNCGGDVDCKSLCLDSYEQCTWTCT